MLMLADPKALHHVLQVSGYRYPKLAAANQSIVLLMGTGIIAAAGEETYLKYEVNSTLIP